MMILSLLILTCQFIEGFTSESFRSAIDADVVVLRSVVDKYRETMGFLREIGDSGDAETTKHFGSFAHDSTYCLEIYEDLFEAILLPSGLELVYQDAAEAVIMSEGVAKACLSISMVLRYLPMTVLEQEQFPSIFARMSSLRDDWRQLSESAESLRETIKQGAAGFRETEPKKNTALDAKGVIRLVGARFDSSFSLINQSTGHGADLSEASRVFVSFQRFLDHEIRLLNRFDELPVLAKVDVLINLGNGCKRMQATMQAMPLEDWKPSARPAVDEFITEWKRLGIRVQLVLRSLEETSVVDDSELDYGSVFNSVIDTYSSTWSLISDSEVQGPKRGMAFEMIDKFRSLIQVLSEYPGNFEQQPHQRQMEILQHVTHICNTIQKALDMIPPHEMDIGERSSIELKSTRWRKLESQIRLVLTTITRRSPAEAEILSLPTAFVTIQDQTFDGSIVSSVHADSISQSLSKKSDKKKSKKKRANQKRTKTNNKRILEDVYDESDADNDDGEIEQALTLTSTEVSETTTATTTTEAPRTSTTTTEEPLTKTAAITTTETPLRTTAAIRTKDSTTTAGRMTTVRMVSTSTKRDPKQTEQGRDGPSGGASDNIRGARNQPRPEVSIPTSEGSNRTPFIDSRGQRSNRSTFRNTPKSTSLQSPAERVRSTTSTTTAVPQTISSTGATTITTLTTSTAASTTTTTATTTMTTTPIPTTSTTTPTTQAPTTTTTEILTTQGLTSTTDEALTSTRVDTGKTATTFAKLEIAQGLPDTRGRGGGRRSRRPNHPVAESPVWTNYQSPHTPWQHQQQQTIMYSAQAVIVPQTIVPVSNQLREMSDALSHTMAQIHQLSQQALQLCIDPNTAALANGNWHAMMETLQSVENLRSRLHAFAQYTESSLPPFLVQSPPGPYQGYNGPHH